MFKNSLDKKIKQNKMPNLQFLKHLKQELKQQEDICSKIKAYDKFI